ncbi:hypothetical protein HK098_002730 [Nowakowskiella sp. JEL0407]|nr:hypothetical protein HK098_002730 [Nowakowskiella sp. JEL0407]
MSFFVELFGGIDVETPKFDLVKKYNSFEIRKYQPQLRISYTYFGRDEFQRVGQGFRPLAGYIFGGNRPRNTEGSDSTQIAMTAPVITSKPTEIAMTAPVITSKPTQIAMTSPVITSKSTQIAMTAPVVTSEKTSESHVMSFILPSKYTKISDLPEPNDPNVLITEIPEKTVAVYKFSGLMSEKVKLDNLAILRGEAEKEGIKLSTKEEKIEVGQYNPPWTLPWLRTNELMVEVEN